MRFILALTLFAVAYADVQVVEQPMAAPSYTKPDISPAWVPVEVMEAVKAAESRLRDGSTVQVVDAPFEQPMPAPVKLGEAPQPAVESVRVVEASLPVVAPVRIAEPSLPVMESVDSVHIVELPQPVMDAVRVIDVSQPIVEPVRVVDAPRYPAKQYPDPTWR